MLVGAPRFELGTSRTWKGAYQGVVSLPLWMTQEALLTCTMAAVCRKEMREAIRQACNTKPSRGFLPKCMGAARTVAGREGGTTPEIHTSIAARCHVLSEVCSQFRAREQRSVLVLKSLGSYRPNRLRGC